MNVPATKQKRWLSLRRRARACRACPLWQPATQTVFGAGRIDASIVLIGEQPGSQEDIEGVPFVGPAGAMLDRALAEAGIDREKVYVTNTVKHFKFEPRGKLRLHKAANAAEQAACRHWLDEELGLLVPDAIVGLGAMAAKALFGSSFRVMRQRGEWRETLDGRRAFATVHPAFILRQRGSAERELAYKGFVHDLRLLAHGRAAGGK